MHAIIGPDTYLEKEFLEILQDKARVPIFSFNSTFSSSSKNPFLVQIKQDDTFQFRGIAAILKLYDWRTINVIYEDNHDGRDILPYLADYVQEENIRIAHWTAISPSSTDDQILNKLQKIKTMQSTINVVHISVSLTSRLFQSAERLGMMREGYAWILSDMTMNLFHTIDSGVAELLQGTLGIMTYVPASSKLRNITLRWRNELYAKDPTVQIRELDVPSLWAYDTIVAIAESWERVGIESLEAGNLSMGLCYPSSDFSYFSVSHCGTRLLTEVERTRFMGLSGNFQILNGKVQSKAYSIVNVIGGGVRRVGFWTPRDGIVKEIQPSMTGRNMLSMRGSGLQAVIWPGDSVIAPKGRFMLSGDKKLRIGVVNNPGFKQLVNVSRDPQSNTTSFSGFCVDVFLAAINSLDYEVPYEFIPYVDEHGQKLGSYSNLIHEVSLQKYDGAVGDITVTANRSLYVDFTLPFTDMGVGYLTRRESNGKWFFLKPLDGNLWFFTAGFFVLMGLVVWIIEHTDNEEFQGSIAQQIGTILWFSFSTLVYAHRERLTSNLSRLVVNVWLFVVLILTSSYTATLSSMLTVKQIQLASESEYIGTRSQNLFIVGGSIKSNLNFNDDHIRLYKSPEELAKALSIGSKKGGVAAIIDEIPYIKIFLGKYGADFDMVATDSTTNGFAFAFQRGSPLVSDMSRAIMKLRDEGKLAMMERAWFRSQSSLKHEEAATAANVLNLDNFSGLFLVSYISFVLALLLHTIFILRKRMHPENIIIKLLVRLKFSLIFRFLSATRNHESEIELC